MQDAFFKHPILNSPYEYPTQHWELDSSGQPTQRIIENRRRAEFITPTRGRDITGSGNRLVSYSRCTVGKVNHSQRDQT